MKTTLAPNAPPPRSNTPVETPAAAPAKANRLVEVPSSFTQSANRLFKLPDVGGLWDKYVERPFAMGRDGFVAVDTNGAIVGGKAPSVRVRDHDFFKSPLDPLLEIISDAEVRDVTFKLPGGAQFSTRTDGAGNSAVPLDQLGRGDLHSGVDPKKGGIVRLDVETPHGTGDEANVLVLPKDYDGPVFVCDIDDTLRDTSVRDLAQGKTQRPIDGARELLQAVADRGIPIVYLSAGPDRIRPGNESFLDQLPKGVLLDRDGLSVKDLDPRSDQQARTQALYKAGVLGQLKTTFPNAQLFGLGDDKYGDAMAYTQQGVHAYIHDVIPGSDHLPADFHGAVSAQYTPEFRNKLAADLDAAIARSASYGGTPPAADPWATELSSTLDQVSHSRKTTENAITPLIDGDAALPEILGTIDGAKRSLYYETFQFHGDHKVTQQIVDRLIAAKERGVTVRVAVDAFGSEITPWNKPNPSVERLRQAGIEVAVYNPIDSLQDLDIHRDHRKTIVADNQTAFVGGMNTGDQYLGPDTPWRLHDVFAKLQGPAVADVAKAFYASWEGAGGSAVPKAEQQVPTPAPVPGGKPVRIITHTPHEDQNIRAAYLAMFDAAKERINVENTYSMTDDLVDGLIAAAKRGVDVRYIVDPGKDVEATLGKKNWQKLLDAGVRMFMYPGPIHTKAISVDGKIASIGSSNVDNMALHRDREIVAVVEDPDFVKRFDEALFDKDLVGNSRGKTIELPKKLDVPFWTRLKQWVIQTVVPDDYE